MSSSPSGATTPSGSVSRAETPTERRARYILDKDAKVENFNREDSIKRFKYLLGLTDLFRHFIDFRAKNDPEIGRILKELDAAGRGKKGNRKSRARRKTEKEEDEELLDDEEHGNRMTVFTEPPFITGTLREYQIQGLNWLVSLHENSISGILADEMGLGKTLQTIAFLGALRYSQGINGPHIVVVPKSTLDNWKREFQKWTPEVNVLVIKGDKDERAQLVQDRLLTCDFDVCITTFELVIKEKASLKRIAWQYIIVDEAHRIKNEDSMLSQIIRIFHSRNRLLITGTPLQNNLHELWALLNFLLPDVFADSAVFDQWFEQGENKGESKQGESNDDAVVQQLHRVLRPFLLRRVKADVEKSLLPKKEINVYVGMSDMQIKWYQKLLEKDIDAVSGAASKREGKTRLLNIVMQLRKCCNHPYLFEGAEPGPPFTTDEHLVYNSGKMVILDKLLKRLKAQGSRVLIFSQMSRMLDIMEDYCGFRDYDYCRIDGSTAHEERISAIDQFNAEGSEKFVFLLTTRAGGLGINLTSADIVILYDSDWNPQADLQAMDRAHRIGQTKQVVVFRFVTENAIEEKVLERAAQKLRLDQLVIQQGRSTQSSNKQAAASKDELLRMIQHGAAAVLHSKSGTLTDDNIESILQRGEEKTSELKTKYSKLGIDQLQKFSSDSSAYNWNGEDFAKKAKENAGLWLNTSRRERKEMTYSVDGYYKDLMQIAKPPRGPRAPRQIHTLDFQFYPARLKELQDKEYAYYRKHSGFKVVEELSEDESDDEKNEILPLTEEEEKEKEELASQGFGNWSKRDLTNFIHMSARFGRHNYKAIARALDDPDKDAAEIERYSKVFWERNSEVEGHERWIQQVEQGEEKIKKLQIQQKVLKQKLEMYDTPLDEMPIVYQASNNTKKQYTEDEDRFLLLQVNELGLDRENLWELVRERIHKSSLFKFDWFLLSRTPVELSRRCSTLLLAVAREIEGPKVMKRKSRKADESPAGTPSVNTARASPDGWYLEEDLPKEKKAKT